MSYKVIRRIYQSSAATGDDFHALVAIGEIAHEDGLMMDPRYTVEVLARYARVSKRQMQRALPALAAAGEIVLFRGDGSGQMSVFGVLVGLDADEAEIIYRRVWNKAAALGGKYYLLDQATAETDPKGCRGVTLFTGRKGDGMSPFSPGKGATTTRKGAVVAPFPADLSISGFPGIPVSTTTGQGAEARGDADVPSANAGRGLPPGVGTGGHVDERMVRRLVGLKVYAHVALREVERQDAAWLDECIRYVEALQRLGSTPVPGGLLPTLIQAGPPLPALPGPPLPAAAAAAAAASTDGPLFAPVLPGPTDEPPRQAPGGVAATLDGLDDESAALMRRFAPRLAAGPNTEH